MVVPLDLNDNDVRAAIEEARLDPDAGEHPELLLVPRPDGQYAGYGTLAVIEQIGRLRGGQQVAVVRGTGRARIGRGTTGPGAALWVEAEIRPEPASAGRAHELAETYREIAIKILQQRGAFQVVDAIKQIKDPSALADSAGYAPYLTLEQKLQLLETTDVAARLELLVEWARTHLTEVEVNESISKDVNEGLEKQQRQFLLRKQQEAIRKELAEIEGRPADENEDYRARVEAADLPEKVREAALKEVDKLERGSDQNPETSWIRTWLDTVLDLPWNKRSEESYDLPGARAVLDADHAGLDDVKERIV